MQLRVLMGAAALGTLFLLPLSANRMGGASMKNGGFEKPFFLFDKPVPDGGYRAVTSMALSPKVDFLVMTSGHIYAFEVATGKKIYQIQHPKKDRGFGIAVFGKDNDRFACFCDDEGLQIREVRTGRVLRTLPEAEYGWMVPPDNGTFLVGLEFRNPTIMTLWDWSDPKPRLQIRRDPPADPDLAEGYPIAFSPDGRIIATGGFQCPFDTWDLATGKRLRRFTGPNPQITWVTFSPDGKTIATASYGDRAIFIWDAVHGKLKQRLKQRSIKPTISTIGMGHKRVFNQIRFSPDGKTLACCGFSPLICRLDPITGKELPAIDTKEERVDCFVFTPDGKRLFSGGPGGIRQWDLATRAEIRMKARK